MEKAIKIAIENGWKSDYLNKFSSYYEVDFIRDGGYKEWGVWFRWVEREGKEQPKEKSKEFLQGEICLDPLFWQALAKANPWWLGHDQNCLGLKGNFILEKDCDCDAENGWKHQMHRFIDHLAEGKDINSFFQNLLS